MITRVTGLLNRVLDEEVRLQVGAVEYQLLVPDFVRRQVQGKHGEEVAFYTNQFLEGNPMQGRMVPRLIGFVTEVELEFFELFCTVDKVGTRKAMKALVRPIKDEGSFTAADGAAPSPARVRSPRTHPEDAAHLLRGTRVRSPRR